MTQEAIEGPLLMEDLDEIETRVRKLAASIALANDDAPLDDGENLRFRATEELLHVTELRTQLLHDAVYSGVTILSGAPL